MKLHAFSKSILVPKLGGLYNTGVYVWNFYAFRNAAEDRCDGGIALKCTREMKFATTIWCDNSAAVTIAKTAVHPKRTRHIAAKYFKVRDLQKFGVVVVDYIPTSDNRADIFTKPLGYVLFWTHGKIIMGGVLPPLSERRVPTSDLDLIY